VTADARDDPIQDQAIARMTIGTDDSPRADRADRDRARPKRVFMLT